MLTGAAGIEAATPGFGAHAQQRRRCWTTPALALFLALRRTSRVDPIRDSLAAFRRLARLTLSVTRHSKLLGMR